MFTALPTANENATENKPKYDPCRPFKKGDKVKRRTVFGRTCNAIGSLGVYTVIEDEKENSGNVIIVDGTNVTYKVKAVFLELVTPVEELEPYYVKDVNVDTGECFETESYEVRKDGVTLAAFFCYNPRAMTKEQAKAAAEAERDRLNAKSRKEQEK